MSVNESESALAASAAKGDKLALERLLMRHSTKLSRHVDAQLPKEIQGTVGTDDIVQQTFIDAFCCFGNFEPRREGAFWAWLRTIADNRILNAVKKHKRLKRGGELQRVDAGHYSDDDLAELLSAGSHSPSKSVARHEAIQAIHDVVRVLPEDYRQAVQLRLFDNKTLEEVAVAMHRTPRAVQGLIDRAKKKMRAALGRLSLYQ